MTRWRSVRWKAVWTGCVLLLAAAALAAAAEPDGVRDRVRAYRAAHEEEILGELTGLLALPNVATRVADIERNADRLTALLERRGFKVRRLSAGEGTPPAVYGELLVPGAKRTLMFYAHYDGQPVGQKGWLSDPFKPVLRSGPPGPGVQEIDLRQAGPLDPEWRLYARSAGSRTGLMDPALNVRGLRAAEVGEGAANAIPTEAQVSIDFRLVPDQTPQKVKEKVEAFLRGKGWHLVTEAPDRETLRAFPRVARIAWSLDYAAHRTDMTLPVSRAVVAAVERAAGRPVVQVPMLGGSVPMSPFTNILKAPMIGVPMVNHDNNQHGVNENLRLQNLWDGIEVYAELMADLGGGAGGVSATRSRD